MLLPISITFLPEKMILTFLIILLNHKILDRNKHFYTQHTWYFYLPSTHVLIGSRVLSNSLNSYEGIQALLCSVSLLI